MWSAALGKGPRFPPARLYGHLCGDHHHLVPAELRPAAQLTADPQQSILAWLASGIAPLFAPLGFADWRVSTALITGFMAKESVVSTLTILYGSSAAFAAALSPAAAAPPAGVLPALYTLHRGGGLGQAGAGRQVGVYHGGKSVHRSMAGGLRHAAHHDAVKKTETGSGLQDAGRSFSLDNRCVFVLLLLQI